MGELSFVHICGRSFLALASGLVVQDEVKPCHGSHEWRGRYGEFPNGCTILLLQCISHRESTLGGACEA